MARGKLEHPFRGSVVALPTPFRGGQVDEEAFVARVERQARAGTAGIAVGTQRGEGYALSEAERVRLFELAVGAAAGRSAILAGIGASDTRISLRLARAAGQAGADGVALVTPAYACPSNAGLCAHFEAVATALPKLPVVLQNSPERTGCEIAVELAIHLSERHRNVVAIQEGSVDLERIHALAHVPGLDLLCGTDVAMLEFMRRGAAGAVHGIGNVLPETTNELLGLAALDPWAPRVTELESLIAPLVRALGIEPGAASLKALLAHLEGGSSEVRLPLVAVGAATDRALRTALRTSRKLVPVG